MPKLKESRMQLAEFAFAQWCITPEAGTALDALLEPAFWAHNARKLRPGAVIWAEPEDGAWFALLRVRSANIGGAKVRVLFKTEEPQVVQDEDPAANGFSVEWGGPAHKFRVKRVADKQVMQSGFQDKADAFRWLSENVEKIAA